MALILSSAGSSSTLPTSSATRKKKKRSQLIDAVNHGNVEKIIKLLVKCDPNFIDESTGETPLSLTASNSSLQTTTTQRVIVALVNGGAMLDFRTREGRTALHVAVLKSNYVALKTFLGLGASPDCQDSNSLTPLFYSIIHKANPKLTQLLLHEHARIGCADQQGWQEAHHACKLGLSGHLENLLYYGTDMNAKIAGSGNTALHVAAINDQKECAKLLLLRGSDTSIVNNSHQNAHQVAVIAGNLELAEMIKNFKSDQVMPYREKPKYNPARQRASNHSPATTTSDMSPALPPPPPPPSSNITTTATSSGHHVNINNKNMSNGTCCPSSPCLSQRSCATSTTISTSTTSSSGVCCELDHSSQTESVSSEDDPRTQISAAGRIEGRREQKILGSSTLPSRGRRANGLMLGKQNSTGSTSSEASSSSASAGTPPITSYTEKTVSLHRGNKGFGFVLRGAKATSPVLRSIQSTEKGVTALQPISLQYLDEIEVGGVAQMAGLAKGDFVLNVNGVDVRKAPHEHVVCLIRQSGDRVIMSVATPVYLKLEPGEIEREKRDAREKRKLMKESAVTSNSDSSSLTTSCSAPQGEILQPNVSKSGSQTLPSRSQVPPSGSVDGIVDSAGRSRSRAPPPAPPRRDPSTTLTVGRNRAKSLCMSDGRDEGTSEGSSIDASESSSSVPSHVDDSSNRQQQHESGSGAAGNCSLNNKHDNYDSEGRSDKSSSSASTSIESMIPNANCASASSRGEQNQSQAASSSSCAAKIASIRSRGARRMSALELQEFFDRQDDGSLINRRNSQTKQTSQTLKSKKNKNKSNGKTSLGGKNYHSVPDIQQELLLEQGKMQTMIESCSNQTGGGNSMSTRLSNSQEDLKKDWIKYAVETVTLKNGKIVQDRNPAPDHPPPPLPPPPASLVPASSDPSTTPSHGLPHPPPSMLMQQTPSATANDPQRKKNDVYAQIKVNPEISGARSSSESGPGMSSFKAPITSSTSGAAASAESDAPHLNAASLGQEMNGKQNQSILKPMKHPNTNRSATAQTSVYTRQPTMDPMDERSSKPFIPEPDYSSEDETAESVNSKVSKDMSTFKTMSQNGGNNTDRKNNDSLIKNGSSGKACGSKSGSSPSRSVTVSRSDSDCSSTQFPPPPPALLCSTKDPVDPVNKVQASIREFERRSSLTGSESSGVTATVSSTNSSTSGSIPTVSGATTGSKAPVTTKLQQTESLSSSNSSKGCHQNVIRMSRSCYEVESSCSGTDNGSSGIASDADDPAVNSCTLSNSKVQTLNRRNSAIVSEKIASLIAQTHPSQAAMSQVSALQQLPSSMKQQGSRTLEKRVSIADPPEQPPTSSVRAAPTTAKTWSEISSAIKAVKGAPVPQLMAGQSVRPVSAPTAKQLSKSGKDAGLAGVNEVDVMAELVPPPPEFAAPPPHSAGQHKVQIQVRSSDPRLVEMSADNLVRVVNPSTGQTHVIHKPQVKTNAPPAVQLHPLQGSERKTSTPPTAQDCFSMDRSQAAAASSGRMSVSMHAAPGNRMLTPQQQAQYDYLQKQQQLSQQQFATLSRAYSGANQIARLVPVSAAAVSGGHSHQHIVHQMGGRPADNPGNRSPQMSRAQFASIAANNCNNNNSSQQQQQQQQHQQTYQMASQGYQQFATLSRAGQKAALAAAAASGQAGGGVQSAYNDFNRLTVQTRMVNQSPQLSQASPGQQHVVQWTPQQLQQLTPQQRQALIQRYQLQQQHQHQQQQQQQVYIVHQHPQEMSHNSAGHSHIVHQHVLGKGHAPPPPPQPMQPPPPGPPPSITHPTCPPKAHPVSFPRKSMVEWTTDDVADWLTSIGMADHRPSFESVNGVKLLRLDNNDLTGMGLRQGQHRMYVMDKIKQYLHYQQQHPPTSAH